MSVLCNEDPLPSITAQGSKAIAGRCPSARPGGSARPVYAAPTPTDDHLMVPEARLPSAYLRRLPRHRSTIGPARVRRPATPTPAGT